MHQISEVQEILYDPIWDSVFFTIKKDKDMVSGVFINPLGTTFKISMGAEEWDRMKRWNILEGLLENTIAEINYDEKLNKTESEQVLIELL